MQHAAVLRGQRAASAYWNRIHSARWRLELVTGDERARVEQFISQAYGAAYGAVIRDFLPQLVGIFRDDELLAACGLREARAERLFLETYLDQPVEHRLSDLTRSHVRRSAIVEIGNLAIARPGAARLLITMLTEHLARRGSEWAVFTAVPTLRNNFSALQIPRLVLGDARPERLDPDVREAWGSYYDCSPQVSAVRVADASLALRARP
jgi:hypothetical protein